MSQPSRAEVIEGLLQEAARLRRHPETDADLRLLNEARTQAGDDPSLLSQVAGALWRNGRLADAARLLEDVVRGLEHTPGAVAPGERAQLMTRLGAAQLRLGELETAVTVLRDALELAGDGYTALQLGNALRFLGEFEAAAASLARAFEEAQAQRDGALAIATLCARGELALDEGQAQPAVERFGRALGLTEFTTDEAMTVAPLAGLSHAHVLWGNVVKAQELGGRALRRADQAGDAVGRTRALLSLGIAGKDPELLKRAETEAMAAPHRPLALRALMARLQLGGDADLKRHAVELARNMRMRRDLESLEAPTDRSAP